MGSAVTVNAASNQPAGRGSGKRFQPGTSGNPAGKPKGARHRVTAAAEKLLEGEAEALTRKAVEMALGGDGQAMRLCLERIYPVRKGRALVMTLPATETASDVAKAMAHVVAQMASGDITPDEATTVTAVLEARRKAIELTEMEERIARLEMKTKQ